MRPRAGSYSEREGGKAIEIDVGGLSEVRVRSLTAKLASSPERLRPIGTLGPDEGNKVGATCARDDSGDAWDGFGTPADG